MATKKAVKKVAKTTKVEKVDPEKKLVVVKQQVTRATHAAQELKIKTLEDLKEASDLLGKIQAVAKFVKDEKDSFTRPSYRAYKELMDVAGKKYNPLLEDCSTAEAIVKEKAIKFRNEENARAKERQDKIEAQTLQKLAENPGKEQQIMDKATERMEAIPTVESKVEGDKGGGMNFKKIRVVKVLNAEEIPRKYLVPNMTLIKEVALSGVEIPGIEVVEEDVVAGAHQR